ncbi:hypothetical protein SAMN02745824_1305 [Parasphingorhabdus marina DSM 22363]|uniref:4-amino-4-deoxy-L-arabinose transferase n=1 Tax=Parasphingorhabdus marina DSM 22363 TaxID=1123272 RepID=A0A1N6CZC2_9SPHN|nr:hypothetical protein [Parasphingorhabdus marina]SIN63862.1 hypothetical protein SAMN02745824_1305 [Parasphingorhabdus marina DSM 22363]
MIAKWVGRFPVFWIWLAVCTVLVLVSWGQIQTGIGWGPDDQLRQVQLRDWLAGQSWFDTTQYRIGEPDSQPMHWPRWNEVPLALVILLLSPVLGTGTGETVAMTAVPLIALGLAIWLVAKISSQLFDRPVALLAAALTATAVPVVMQLRPMRIDHHGWQIVMALLVLWTMFWPDRRRGGIAMGAALALWLSISLEGLPLSVAFVALLAWRWVISLDEGKRLFWTLLSFLVTSGGLFLASQGFISTIVNYCDAVSPGHLVACLAGGAIVLPAIHLAPQAVAARVIALGLAGAAALGVFYLSAPQCTTGAFSSLDPLVRDYWLVSVREGLPIWVQPWKTSMTLLGGAILVGLLSLVYIALRRRREFDQEKLILLAYAFLWALAVSLLVQRASAVAAAYALPFMAWAVHQAFVAARKVRSPLVRILATASVVFLIMPGPLAISVINSFGNEPASDGAEASGTTPLCDSAESLARLSILPRSNIVAPFDFGPEILLLTDHNVLATSHHRNSSAMSDQIRLFISTPAEARTILESRSIGYIVTCPDEDELQIYRERNPESFVADLLSDKSPDWLHPVHIRDSQLQVWRIVRKELRNDP